MSHDLWMLLLKTTLVGGSFGGLLAFFALRDIRKSERLAAANRKRLNDRKAEHE